MSKCKTTVVTFEEFHEEYFKHPSAFFIRDCMGDYVFFHTRSRETAQEWCDKCYDGMYKVNSGKMGKAPESQSARGFINSKSRAGMRKPS